jgi:hypothetical protein
MVSSARVGPICTVLIGDRAEAGVRLAACVSATIRWRR